MVKNVNDIILYLSSDVEGEMRHLFFVVEIYLLTLSLFSNTDSSDWNQSRLLFSTQMICKESVKIIITSVQLLKPSTPNRPKQK